MKVFRPMLAVACEDLTKVKYPVMLSEKLDGIRMSVHDGVCMSRSMKPIPSKIVQEKFGKAEYNGFDGEIIYGNKNAPDVFNKSTRVCMSHNLPDGFDASEIKYFVFDRIGEAHYAQRYEAIISGWPEVTAVYRLPYFTATCAEDVERMEASFLAMGAEGVILRSVDGPYKQGRSTVKEGYLLKVKQFTDSEAVVIGFVEKMHNGNEATVGELGQTKRQTLMGNMVAMDTLGSLHVRDVKTGVDFHIGTGFNDQQRQEIWDNKAYWFGKIVKYSHFEAGAKDKPRFPVFLGERMKEDMS